MFKDASSDVGIAMLTFFFFCDFSESTFYVFVPKENLDGVSCLLK